MNRILMFLTLLTLTACGDGLVAPISCQSFPSLSLYTGEMETVTPCFTDESGLSLSYSVTSSSPSVDAVLQGARVVITAVSPGEALVTITASNGDASGAIEFTVTVPNREPEIIEQLKDIRLGVERVVKRDLSTIFSDPDMQELTYSVTTTPGIALASISGDTLTIEGVREGHVELVISASDGDISVSTGMSVSVIPFVLIYSDEFDDDSGGWHKSLHNEAATGLEIDNGQIAVWSLLGDARGVAVKGVSAVEWEVQARIRAGAKQTHAVLGILVNHPIWTHVELDIGLEDDFDFRIDVSSRTHGFSEWLTGKHGLAAHTDYVDIRFWYEGDQYHLSLNGGETYSVGDAETTSDELSLLAFLSDHWYYDILGERVYMDRIRVSGLDSSTDQEIVAGERTWR